VHFHQAKSGRIGFCLWSRWLRSQGSKCDM
jgi:hypothetical protein